MGWPWLLSAVNLFGLSESFISRRHRIADLGVTSASVFSLPFICPQRRNRYFLCSLRRCYSQNASGLHSTACTGLILTIINNLCPKTNDVARLSVDWSVLQHTRCACTCSILKFVCFFGDYVCLNTDEFYHHSSHAFISLDRWRLKLMEIALKIEFLFCGKHTACLSQVPAVDSCSTGMVTGSETHEYTVLVKCSC
jgi:hypothetical protein